jgi:hypothetical protein
MKTIDLGNEIELNIENGHCWIGDNGIKYQFGTSLTSDDEVKVTATSSASFIMEYGYKKLQGIILDNEITFSVIN